MTITLTQGQKKAADAFFDFLMGPEIKFAISGTAGTGKTFLMAYLANDIMKTYADACSMLDMDREYTSVVFTATTNKAADVLQSALGKPVSTIHSFLGLKVKEDYKTGKTTLEKTRQFYTRSKLIVFVDECSMIDRALYELMLEALPDCKLVFVGDHAQMAPVGERLSAIYEDLPEKHMVTLTEPVRNAGQPALVALCAQLRDTVETGIFHPIQEVPGVIDYLDDELMEQALHTHFQDHNPSCRVLCYTNTRVKAFNEYIREEVRQLPLEPQVGDVMVMADAYTDGPVVLSVENEVTIVFKEPEQIERIYASVAGGELIPYWPAVVRPVGSISVEVKVRIPKNPLQISRILKAFAKNRDWSNFFELKGDFVDMRDKAACTVYKAQGSTYDSVFLHLGNIGTSWDAEQVARMLFVGASRARSRIFLYGNLPSRYHNSKGKALWQPDPTNSKSLSPHSSTN